MQLFVLWQTRIRACDPLDNDKVDDAEWTRRVAEPVAQFVNRVLAYDLLRASISTLYVLASRANLLQTTLQSYGWTTKTTNSKGGKESYPPMEVIAVPLYAWSGTKPSKDATNPLVYTLDIAKEATELATRRNILASIAVWGWVMLRLNMKTMKPNETKRSPNIESFCTVVNG